MMTLMMTFMASIYKDPKGRSPYWYVSFFGADGKQVRKSTKTTERKDALKFAVEWEELAMAGKNGTLVAAQARKVVAEIVEKATGEPLHFTNAADYLNEWIKGKTGVVAGSSLSAYRQVVRDFLESLGKRANLPLGAISSADVTRYRDGLSERGIAPSTVTNKLKALSIPFKAAHTNGLIPLNPCAMVERLRDTEKGGIEAFTDEQITALFEAAEGDWKGFVLWGVHTGLRLMDNAGLRWENVNMDLGFTRTKTSKSQKLMEVAFHPDMARWLSTRPQGLPKAFVFPELAGSKQSALSKAFARIMQKAGVVGSIARKARGPSGRSRMSLTEHSLRHTFCTRMGRTNAPLDLRKKLATHSDDAVNALYTHYDREQVRGYISQHTSVYA